MWAERLIAYHTLPSSFHLFPSLSVYTSLNLLGLYHDSLLSSLLSSPSSATANTPSLSLIASPSPSSPLQHTPSPHARYTTQLSKTSLSYRLLARALVVLSHTELLSEMIARRRLGRKGAWDVVLSIECVKPTIQPPLPEREVDPAVLEEERTRAIARLESSSPPVRRVISTRKSRSTTNGVHIENVDENGDHFLANSKAILLEQENQRNPTFWRGSRTGFTRPTLASLRVNSFPPPPVTPDSNLDHQNTQSRLSLSHPLTSTASKSRSGSFSSSSSSDETLVDPSSTLLFPPTTSSHQQPSWTQREVDDYLLSRTLKPTDVRPAEELVRQLRGNLGKFSEILWVTRPLFYVLALRRFTVRSYKPWLISFLMEWLSRYLFKKSSRIQSGLGSGNIGSDSMVSTLILVMIGNNRLLSFFFRRVLGIGNDSGKAMLKPISEVDENEFSKRRRAFWWYLIRGPAWFGYTRPKLEEIVRSTESRPVLGLVGSVVKDYLPLIDEYYYYTAT